MRLRAPQFPEYRFRAPVGDTRLGFANSDATRYLVKLPPGSIRADGAAKRHFDRRQTYESRHLAVIDADLQHDENIRPIG